MNSLQAGGAVGVEARQLMYKHNFSSDRIYRSIVWAAKHRDCVKCLVPAGFPCHNMADVRKGIPHVIRSNKWPHDERVDWNLLLRTLRQKGYT
jgi:hypothetical protein